MVFGTASAERMRINANGLGIGTTSPAAKLHISGDANTRLQIDATTTQGIYFTKAGADNGTYRVDTNGNFEWYTKSVSQAMVLTAAGNVGIGTANPASALEVVGTTTLSGELKTTHYTESVVAIGNSGTTQTLALTSGTVQTCTLTGNCTFTMPTATAGKSFVMLLKTGAGSFTATFTGVKWPGNVAPTITATAAKLEVISFIADGTNWYGNISQNYTP
jgi:hypothetical protein